MQLPDWRSSAKWLAVIIPLLPLAAGQGWIAEVVFVLVVFVQSGGGIGYFLPFFMDYTRTLVPLPFALALLTPWPEWTIAAMLVASWLATAGITGAIAARMFPGQATTVTVAFFLVGLTAYDTSLLHAGYVQLLIASMLHWAGLLLLVQYCESRSRGRLVASTLFQILSVGIYATAIPAVALGPVVAFAIMSSRTSVRDALRSALVVATAWWSVVIVYLIALFIVAGQKGSYVVAGGGLSFPHDYPAIALKLVLKNFNPAAWLVPVQHFGDPPRLFGAAVVWLLVALSATSMIAPLLKAWRTDLQAPPVASPARIIAALFAVVVACNLATAALQMAEAAFRTHLISRLYAALALSAMAAVLLRSTDRVVRGAAFVAVLAFLVCGVWTVVDRTNYLTSIWPRHRAELRSLDETVRRLSPKAAIVLYVPPGSGYTATVAPWHALPWLMLIRGGRLPPDHFALWSPDRGALCDVHGETLRCHGDQQKSVDIPTDQLVVLAYDAQDCGYKVVERGDMPALAGTRYQPLALVQPYPAPVSAIFAKLLYGPQGLARNVGCKSGGVGG